ncbi:MAG TPA: hypothetical protein VGK67_18325 [Myxococcales bacterium]
MASKIGEILQAKGRLTGPQLEEALKKQAESKETKARLGTLLVEMGIVDVDQVAEALSEQRGFPPATRKDFEAATAITLVCIPAPFAQQFKAFPLRREAGKLVVAFATPYERSQVEPVRSMAGMEIVPCIAPELLLLYYQEMRYRLKRPERFAHWSPAPSAPGSGASHPPAATDPRHATVRFGAHSSAPLSSTHPAAAPERQGTALFGAGTGTPLSPAPAAGAHERQGTALFGAGTSAPLSTPPAPAQPKFSIPPPSATPGSPSQPARFSLLDPKPAGLSSPAATPSVPAPSHASKPIPTPSPLPAIPAPPQVSKPIPTPSPLPAIPAPPQVSKPIPTPSPLPAISSPPVAETAPEPAKVVDASATVRVSSPVPVEAKRSEPELAGETVRVASPTIPKEAKLPFSSLASEPEPFSTPRPPGSAGLEGPTTPISPELLAIAQQPEAPPSSFFASLSPAASEDEPPIVQGDPLVNDPTPIAAVGSGPSDSVAVSGWGDVMPAEIPAPAPVIPAPPVVLPPFAAPVPSAAVPAAVPAPTPAATPAPVAPAAADPVPKRITKEEMPAAILASEVETGLKVAQSRREVDRDVTLPRIVAARDLMEASVGKPLESGPAVKSPVTTSQYGKPGVSDSPQTEETTLPERMSPPVAAGAEPALPVATPGAEPSLAQLASELSEPIATPKAEAAPSPADLAKTAPPPPRKTVKERPDRPFERPVMNAAVAPPAGNKLFLGVGLGAAAVLVLGGVGVLLAWPKPPPPPPAPVVCKECAPLPPPPPEPQKATLEGSDGLVERLGLDGEWVPAAVNAVVADGEQVRTGQGARAKLRVGAGMVVVGEYSRIALRSATTAAHRFRLNAGFASFQYNSAALPFEIELAGGKVVASGKADLTAFADDLRTALSPRAGALTVAAASGAGKKVDLAVGKQVIVTADGNVADATELPPKLELNLEAPKKGDKVWVLEGTVVGGPARVVVEGTPVQVDAASHFAHSLKMPAKGPFSAAAVDVAGHRVAQEFPATAAGAPKKAPAPKKDKKGPGKGK